MALRRKIYRSIDKLQVDLDDWIDYYSGQRTSGQNVLRQAAYANADRSKRGVRRRYKH